MTYNSSFNLNFEELNPEEVNNSHYNASVPIAVYRQLTEELNITQTRLKFAEQKNRKLAQENEQLKRELALVLKQGEDLKAMVNNFEFKINYYPDNTVNNKENIYQESQNNYQEIKPKSQNRKVRKKTKNRIIKEVTATKPNNFPSAGIKGGGGLLMAIALVFVILTTLGLGFMAIHSILGNSQSK